MLYIVEFIFAVLFLGGAALFGVFALSKFLALLLAFVLTIVFVKIEGSKGLLIIAAGFFACLIITYSIGKVFL